MNWDDPVARAQLIELVGVARYNEMLSAHLEQSAPRALREESRS